MRTMEIKEIDSGCYSIITKDFQDGDSVEWNWDSTGRNFYGEYQIATIDKRRFERERYDIKDYPTIGDAVAFIWKRDRELYDERFAARIPRHRVIDRITV